MIIYFLLCIHVVVLYRTSCTRDNEHVIGGSCFFTLSQDETFNEGETRCGSEYNTFYENSGTAHPVHLCSIHTEAEMTYLETLSSNFTGLWIGLEKISNWSVSNTDDKGFYSWSDGSVVDYLPDFNSDDDTQMCHTLDNNGVAVDVDCGAGNFQSCCRYSLATCSGYENDDCVCVADDFCVCPNNPDFDNRMGNNCGNWTCNGIASSKKDVVCSGNGNCTKTDVCVCNEGLSGTFCEDKFIWGVPFNDFIMYSAIGGGAVLLVIILVIIVIFCCCCCLIATQLNEGVNPFLKCLYVEKSQFKGKAKISYPKAGEQREVKKFSPKSKFQKRVYEVFKEADRKDFREIEMKNFDLGGGGPKKMVPSSKMAPDVPVTVADIYNCSTSEEEEDEDEEEALVKGNRETTADVTEPETVEIIEEVKKEESSDSDDAAFGDYDSDREDEGKEKEVLFERD